MFKQLLQVDLSQPHDKQSYSLKKNELVIRSTNQSVPFHAICYSSEDTISKIVYEVVGLVSAGKAAGQTLTVTFNYDLPAADLLLLVEKLLSVKMLGSGRCEVGHFEIRNGHISDYNKGGPRGGQLIDDLDQFEKEIDNCLKLERLWKISEYLSYREVTLSNLREGVVKGGQKFGKRSNEFFVVGLGCGVKMAIVVLPRSREFLLTREEERELEELYILQRHAQQTPRPVICFTTPLASIVSNYLERSPLNLFVSALPLPEKQLTDALKLPLRMTHPREAELRSILESYTRDKCTQLDAEVDKMRRRLRDLQFSVKAEQDNMQRLVKIYSKTFAKTFPSIDYLRGQQIRNVHTHAHSLKQQIAAAQQEVQAEEGALRQIHREIILDQERHLFYLNKITKFRDALVSSAVATPKSVRTRQQSEEEGAVEPSEQELMYFYDPHKEISRYREAKEEELRTQLNNSQQKKEFGRLMEEARNRLGKADLCRVQQELYELMGN